MLTFTTHACLLRSCSRIIYTDLCLSKSWIDRQNKVQKIILLSDFLVLINMTIYRKPENWPIYLFLRNLQIDYNIHFWMGDSVTGLTAVLLNYSLNHGHIKVLYLLTWIDRHSKQQSFKNNYREKKLLIFYNLQSACVNRRLPKATQSSKKKVAYFGSFHLCQQLFSLIKLTKTKFRSKLADVNLKIQQKIALATISSDINKLVSMKQCQIFHCLFYLRVFNFETEKRRKYT